MSRRFAVIVWLVGCGFHVNGAAGTDAPLPTPDATIDGAPEQPDALIDAAIDAAGSDGSGSGSDGSGGSGSDGSGSAVSCWSRWTDGSIGSAFGSAVPIAAADVAGRNERDPFLTMDELSLYFSDEGSDYAYVATRGSAGSDFGAASPFAAANVDNGNGASKVSISADGTTLIVQRGGSASLWIATGSGGSDWSALTTNGLTVIDGSGASYDPELGSNGLSFIYAPSFGGTQHLEMATRMTTGDNFTSAAIPGFSTNPAEGQADPWLDATGTLLVFSQSDGGGDTNIYYARADGSAVFGAPVAITSVNTAAAEGDPWVSTDGCRIYFSSTRGSGAYHVWVGSAAPE